MSAKKGDAVFVRGTVTGFNVGGEMRIDFGHAYGSPSGETWVSRAIVSPAESWPKRFRRRIAGLLEAMAARVLPVDERL